MKERVALRLERERKIAQELKEQRELEDRGFVVQKSTTLDTNNDKNTRERENASDEEDSSSSEDSLNGSSSDSDSDESDNNSDNDDSDHDSDESESEKRKRRKKKKEGKLKLDYRTTLGNKEDMPKYLINLEPNAPYYDPKSRSMRGDPNPDVPLSEKEFAGDNYYRMTGNVLEYKQQLLFAMELAKKHEESNNIDGEAPLNPAANPTALELARREYLANEQKTKEEARKKAMEEYGVKPKDSSSILDPRVKYGESVTLKQYALDGKEVKQKKQVTEAAVRFKMKSSKYDEDFFPGNHTSIWGSWYNIEKKEWGYQCCHQTEYRSLCRQSTSNNGEGLSEGVESVEKKKNVVEGDNNSGTTFLKRKRDIEVEGKKNAVLENYEDDRNEEESERLKKREKLK